MAERVQQGELVGCVAARAAVRTRRTCDWSSASSAWQSVIDAYSAALRGADRLERVVVLSGWAANHDGARGPVWGLRRLEDSVTKAVGCERVSVLRPGWFVENAPLFIEQIRATGTATGLIPSDLPLPTIATRDIEDVAAQILTGGRVAPVITELQGPADRTLDEIARVIGAHLGVPGAAYRQITI